MMGCLPCVLQAGSEPLFRIQLTLGETPFPSNIGLYDPPIMRFITVVNQSGVAMPINYSLPLQYTIDAAHSTCGATLNQSAQCQLAVAFNPSKLGHFTGQIKVCGHQGLWCSVDPIGFDVTVTNNDIVSTECSAIKSRPFAALDCAGSSTYAQNFYSFLSRVLHVTEPAASQHFHYFQHTPSSSETTIPCLQARQSGVNLDPAIQGGGGPLCDFMAYANSNSSSEAAVSKLFPPYLTSLLGTAYPILPNTVVLDKLPELLATFGHPVMDSAVQDLGYNGYVNLINSYYLQQNATLYSNCGGSAVCPALYYLPYPSDASTLQTWPPDGINYWGMSGGGGSGAGYQIEAFEPGSAKHYILFSGGGGGGGGNTTPEDLNTPHITLLNMGSGGGGGSQFAACYLTADGNLNGLGLGAGTGAGLSAIEGQNIVYQPPPATDYSYYPPNAYPTWPSNRTLASYGTNLDYLFHTLIPELYNTGYTITITGGGGGGTGLEFLNSVGEEYSPQPVSIGYGFNFCYVFNKEQKHTATDCISSENANSASAILLDNLIYKNIGLFFTQGMNLAVSTCTGGYSNYACTCSFQHAYVICELTNLLIANGFSSSDIPTWLINAHCNDTVDSLTSHAALMDQLPMHSAPSQCATSIKNFYQAKQSNTCVPPWPH